MHRDRHPFFFIARYRCLINLAPARPDVKNTESAGNRLSHKE
jgi:hypothetical protein